MVWRSRTLCFREQALPKEIAQRENERSRSKIAVGDDLQSSRNLPSARPLERGGRKSRGTVMDIYGNREL
jgi:hypothetical protein